MDGKLEMKGIILIRLRSLGESFPLTKRCEQFGGNSCKLTHVTETTQVRMLLTNC